MRSALFSGKKNAQAVGIIARFGDKGETPDTLESVLNGPLKSGWGSNEGWAPFTRKWDLRHQYKGFSDSDIALLESTRRNAARASVLLAQAGKLSKSQVTALQLRGLGVLADATLNLALALAPFDSVASLTTRSLLGAAGAVADAGATKAVGSAAEEANETGTPSTASQILPGGSLQASEDAGGHLLAKHVGKTDAELTSRAMTDPFAPGVVSSFSDKATAEAAAAQAIDANSGKIAKWLAAGKGSNLVIPGTLNRSVGRIITKEGVSVATSSSTFVLKPDAISPTGYYILTGFPDTH